MSYSDEEIEALDAATDAGIKWRSWEPEWGPCPSPLAGLDYSVVDEAVEALRAIKNDIARCRRLGISAEQAREFGAAAEVIDALREDER